MITIYKYKPDQQDKPKYFKNELDLLKQLKKDNQNTEYRTEVYQTECYKCREQIEYTELHSFCPNCLTSV